MNLGHVNLMHPIKRARITKISLMDLPDDNLHEIATHTCPATRVLVSHTCKRFFRIASGDNLIEAFWCAIDIGQTSLITYLEPLQDYAGHTNIMTSEEMIARLAQTAQVIDAEELFKKSKSSSSISNIITQYRGSEYMIEVTWDLINSYILAVSIQRAASLIGSLFCMLDTNSFGWLCRLLEKFGDRMMRIVWASQIKIYLCPTILINVLADFSDPVAVFIKSIRGKPICARRLF